MPEFSIIERFARKLVPAAVVGALLSSACGKYEEVEFFKEPDRGRPTNPGVGVGRAEVLLNRCPQITSLVVTPLETGVGGIVTMQASAEDPEGDPVSLEWSVTQGEVERSEPSGSGGNGGASASEGGSASGGEGGADGGSAEGTWIYQCTQIGFPLLTLEAADARGCSQERSVGVGCVAPP